MVIRQLGFYDYPRSIDAAFERFHAAHPEVYAGLVTLARRWRAHGPAPWSIDAAYHVLRWERRIAGLPDADEEYKLNNNYTSRYARLILDNCPDLAGIFATRELRS